MMTVRATARRQLLWDGTPAVYLHLVSGPMSTGLLLDVSDAVGLAEALYTSALDEDAYEGNGVADT